MLFILNSLTNFLFFVLFLLTILVLGLVVDMYFPKISNIFQKVSDFMSKIFIGTCFGAISTIIILMFVWGVF